jgi:hypothetical protein
VILIKILLCRIDIPYDNLYSLHAKKDSIKVGTKIEKENNKIQCHQGTKAQRNLDYLIFLVYLGVFVSLWQHKNEKINLHANFTFKEKSLGLYKK